MKALKSKYFSIVLQILAFFKYQTKHFHQLLSEHIKLMNVEQLYLNIVNEKFDTVLIRDIIVFLLSRIYNKNFDKHRLAGANHYFMVGSFQNMRPVIQKHYYTQMALSEYFYLIDDEQTNQQQYQNVYNFCELQQDLKFKILSKLVKNASENIGAESSKLRREAEKQQKNQENKTKKPIHVDEIAVLGQDNKYVYFFVPFIPQYVLSYYMGNWQTLDRNQITNKIKQILQNQQQTTNNLFLCESLDTVLTKYLKSSEQIQTPVRLHKIDEVHTKMAEQRVASLKKSMLEINQRYNYFLYKFNNRCWYYLKEREQYIQRIGKAQNINELIEAFKQFYLVSYNNIYINQCDDETQIPQETRHEFYKTQSRPTCNIHTVHTKLRADFAISGSEITLRIIQQSQADKHALFELNIMILRKSIQFLQQKQKKFYAEKERRERALAQKTSTSQQSKIEEKHQAPKKILRQRDHKVKYSQNSMKLSSLSSINPRNSKQKIPKMQLKLRQKKPSKKFGVTMIDSDDSGDSVGSDQQYVNSKSSQNFEQYHYKKSKLKNCT